MREKEEKLIITFHTTSAAIAMEKHCKANGLPGRLIPVPRSITSDCGIAWSSPPELRSALETAMQEAGIEPAGFHTCLL